MDFIIESKPLRASLRWQAYAILIVALLAGVSAGAQGALSALLGGLVVWLAGLVFAMMISRGGKIKSVGAALRMMFQAEAGKILVVVWLLWLILSTYRDLVPSAFFVAFVISVLVSQTAILVRES